MNVYPPLPAPLPPEIIARAERLSSALLADGMKGLGIENDGAMRAEILPLDKNMRVVGTAMTVESSGGDNYPIHVATYTTPPGYVMVIDGKGYRGGAYIGSLLVGSAKAVGFKGIVLDGCSRDLLDCLEIGLPVFSAGLMQKGPPKKEPGALNLPITCAGVLVAPGDLVLGDADGVTVVPRARIEEVFVRAEEKLAYEEKRSAQIAAYARARAAGQPLPKLMPQWVEELLG